jgi:hypothetical protein
MSHALLKLAVLVAAITSTLTLASSASATNWTSNGTAGGAAFTATAPAAKLIINSPSAPATICTNVSETGALFGPTGPINTGPWVHGADVHLIFASCTIAGLTATVQCGFSSMVTWLAHAGLSLITGHVTGWSCTITRGSCMITLTGEVTMRYDATAFLKTMEKLQQALSASAPGVCNSITGFTAAGGGAASVQFGSNTTPIGDLTYTMTSAFKPVVS